MKTGFDALRALGADQARKGREDRPAVDADYLLRASKEWQAPTEDAGTGHAQMDAVPHVSSHASDPGSPTAGASSRFADVMAHGLASAGLPEGFAVAVAPELDCVHQEMDFATLMQGEGASGRTEPRNVPGAAKLVQPGSRRQQPIAQELAADEISARRLAAHDAPPGELAAHDALTHEPATHEAPSLVVATHEVPARELAALEASTCEPGAHETATRAPSAHEAVERELGPRAPAAQAVRPNEPAAHESASDEMGPYEPTSAELATREVRPHEIMSGRAASPEARLPDRPSRAPAGDEPVPQDSRARKAASGAMARPALHGSLPEGSARRELSPSPSGDLPLVGFHRVPPVPGPLVHAADPREAAADQTFHHPGISAAGRPASQPPEAAPAPIEAHSDAARSNPTLGITPAQGGPAENRDVVFHDVTPSHVEQIQQPGIAPPQDLVGTQIEMTRRGFSWHDVEPHERGVHEAPRVIGGARAPEDLVTAAAPRPRPGVESSRKIVSVGALPDESSRLMAPAGGGFREAQSVRSADPEASPGDRKAMGFSGGQTRSGDVAAPEARRSPQRHGTTEAPRLPEPRPDAPSRVASSPGERVTARKSRGEDATQLGSARVESATPSPRAASPSVISSIIPDVTSSQAAGPSVGLTVGIADQPAQSGQPQGPEVVVHAPRFDAPEESRPVQGTVEASRRLSTDRQHLPSDEPFGKSSPRQERPSRAAVANLRSPRLTPMGAPESSRAQEFAPAIAASPSAAPLPVAPQIAPEAVSVAAGPRNLPDTARAADPLVVPRPEIRRVRAAVLEMQHRLLDQGSVSGQLQANSAGTAAVIPSPSRPLSPSSSSPSSPPRMIIDTTPGGDKRPSLEVSTQVSSKPRAPGGVSAHIVDGHEVHSLGPSKSSPPRAHAVAAPSPLGRIGAHPLAADPIEPSRVLAASSGAESPSDRKHDPKSPGGPVTSDVARGLATPFERPTAGAAQIPGATMPSHPGPQVSSSDPRHLTPAAGQPGAPPGPTALLDLATDDPSLHASALGKNAHLRLETARDGDLSVHLQVRDGVVDVRFDGAASRTLDLNENQIRVALAGEGISLGSFESRSTATDAVATPLSPPGSPGPTARGDAAPAGEAGRLATPSQGGSHFGGGARHSDPGDRRSDREPAPPATRAAPSGRGSVPASTSTTIPTSTPDSERRRRLHVTA